MALCYVYDEGDLLRLQHLDGTEVRIHPDADSFRLLGRYAGYVNQRGIARASNAAYDENALSAATLSTT